MKTVVLSFLVCILFPLSLHAAEREIVSGGEALKTEDFKTESHDAFYDIYKRQHDYLQSQQAYRSSIERRRDHYNAARAKVVGQSHGTLQAP